MKKILFLYFTNSGQTESVVDRIKNPMLKDDDVRVVTKKIMPKIPYRYPWTLLGFFSEFPDAVLESPCEIQDLNLSDQEKYDLVVLCYPVWFLSICTPVLSFLKSKQAAILKDTPVVTAITCRNMWSRAQTRMQFHLKKWDALLVGNIVLRDRSGNKASTFVTTPLWLLTGKKKISKYMPDAGIDPKKLEECIQHGESMLCYVKNGKMDPKSKIQQDKVPASQFMSEKIGKSIFLVWGYLIKKISKSDSIFRDFLIIAFLCSLILTALFCLPVWYFSYSLFQKITGKPTFKQVVHLHERSISS